MYIMFTFSQFDDMCVIYGEAVNQTLTVFRYSFFFIFKNTIPSFDTGCLCSLIFYDFVQRVYFDTLYWKLMSCVSLFLCTYDVYSCRFFIRSWAVAPSPHRSQACSAGWRRGTSLIAPPAVRGRRET